MLPDRFSFLTLAAVVALGAPLAAQQPGPAPAKQDAASTHSSASQHDRRDAEKLFLEGARSLEHDDPRAANEDFTHAHALDPENPRYGPAAEIARQHLVTQLVQQADKAKLLGHESEWRQDLTEAYRLDPRNPIIVQHLDELADSMRQTAQPLTVKSNGIASPIEIAPASVRRSFHLRTDEQSLLRQVLSDYGITAVLDSSVKSRQVRFDEDNVDFQQAANSLKLVTDTFFVPLDPVRVLVAADTKENRLQFERQIMETVYLPGLTPTEISDMGNIARNIFGAEHASVEAGAGTMTIRAPEPQLAALNQTLTDLLAGRSEVQLDVRLYEIDRTRLANLGVILPNQSTIFNIPSELNSVLTNNASLVQQIISSGLASPGDYAAIAAILIASGQVSGSILSQPFGYFGGGLTLTGLTLGGGNLNLLLNSSDVRSLDQMQLRALDQEETTVRSGTRYPIITSSYSSLGGSSLSIAGINSPGLSSALQGLGINLASLAASTSQTIPQVQYQDLGLTLTVTPRIVGNSDVGLKMDLKLTALQGSTINDIPVLDSREFSGIIALKPGDSAFVMSSMSRQESIAVTGVPGLSELPGLGGTTNKEDTKDITELAIVITPRIVRRVHTSEASKMLLLAPHS